jgi:uncharacterized protein YggE
MILWLALMALTPPVWADGHRLVTVQGKCELEVVPDRASLQLSSSSAGLAEVNKQVANARDGIKKLGAKDLEFRTTHLQIKGSRASLGLEVITSDVKLLSKVLDEGVKAGLTGADHFNTFLSSEKKLKEYLKCLYVAAVDAKRKAQQLANSLNEEIGDVQSMTESPVTELSSRVTRKLESATPHVEYDDQILSATVQVTYRLK